MTRSMGLVLYDNTTWQQEALVYHAIQQPNHQKGLYSSLRVVTFHKSCLSNESSASTVREQNFSTLTHLHLSTVLYVYLCALYVEPSRAKSALQCNIHSKFAR